MYWNPLGEFLSGMFVSRLIETWDVLKYKTDAQGLIKSLRLIETWDVLKCAAKNKPMKNLID